MGRTSLPLRPARSARKLGNPWGSAPENVQKPTQPCHSRRVAFARIRGTKIAKQRAAPPGRSVMHPLSGLDAAFLYLETPRNPMNVVGTLVLDPSTSSSGCSLERLVDGIDRRLPQLPPLRRRLREMPLGLGHPVWVDDARTTSSWPPAPGRCATTSAPRGSHPRSRWWPRCPCRCAQTGRKAAGTGSRPCSCACRCISPIRWSSC